MLFQWDTEALLFIISLELYFSTHCLPYYYKSYVHMDNIYNNALTGFNWVGTIVIDVLLVYAI